MVKHSQCVFLTKHVINIFDGFFVGMVIQTSRFTRVRGRAGFRGSVDLGDVPCFVCV